MFSPIKRFMVVPQIFIWYQGKNSVWVMLLMEIRFTQLLKIPLEWIGWKVTTHWIDWNILVGNLSPLMGGLSYSLPHIEKDLDVSLYTNKVGEAHNLGVQGSGEESIGSVKSYKLRKCGIVDGVGG